MSDDDYEDFVDDDDYEEIDDSEEENENEGDEDNVDRDFDIEDVIVSSKKENKLINLSEMETLLNSKDKCTSDKITKYEYTKVIGLRSTQISLGMPPLTDIEELQDPYLIAIKEYQENKIPFIIQRPLPDGESFEYWRLEDLKKNNNILI